MNTYIFYNSDVPGKYYAADAGICDFSVTLPFSPIGAWRGASPSIAFCNWKREFFPNILAQSIHVAYIQPGWHLISWKADYSND